MITRGIGIRPAGFIDSIRQSIDQHHDGDDAGDRGEQTDDLADAIPVRAFSWEAASAQMAEDEASETIAQQTAQPTE